MNDDEPVIRDISDTARWMAVFRARETARPDAAFSDPFARALAGAWGDDEQAMIARDAHAWPFIARTYLFDRFVSRLIEHGVDLVVNLAAGLDTRPYRMALPASLRWVEVDLPDILDYKEEILGDAKPSCELERVRVDLTNEDARRGLFARLGRGARHAAVLSEGLLVYLMPDAVGALADDLGAAVVRALGGGHRVAARARSDEGTARRRDDGSGRAVPIRARGGRGVLRGARLAADRSALADEDRRQAGTAAARVADVRDDARARGRSGRSAVVGRLPSRSASSPASVTDAGRHGSRDCS